MAGRAIEKGELVCVTGASGYIGSHVVEALLRRGYRVRGTVRDATAADKTAHLKKIAEDTGGSLELVSADLTKAGAFDEAVEGCSHVCHVASSVRLTADDPQKQIIDVAVNGTTNILASLDAAGSARRLVVTSSIAAVVDEDKPLEHTFDESDWNESSTVSESPYPLSKTMAERAAWKHVESKGDDPPYDLVVINPTLVLGPLLAGVHGRSSPALLKDLLTGKFPATPDFRFGVVDVRDVALAHVRALEVEGAEGRYILNNRSAALPELAAMLRRAFPKLKTPKRTMPNFLMYGVALFDKRLSFGFLKRNLSIVRRLDATKSRESLGIDYRDIESTVRDTGQSVVDLGLA